MEVERAYAAAGLILPTVETLMRRKPKLIARQMRIRIVSVSTMLLALLLSSHPVMASERTANTPAQSFVYPEQPSSLEDLPTCMGPDAARTVVAGGRKLHCYPGNMGGIKLLIPNYFLLSYPEYDGRNWLSREPLNTNPTFDNVISNFAIRLRSGTLLPVVTAADFGEVLKPSRNLKDAYQQWIIVSFEPEFSSGLSFMERERRARLDSNNEVTYAGELHGLDVFESAKYSRSAFEEGADFRQQVLSNKDFSTIILCRTYAIKKDPSNTFRSCDHHFMFDRLRLVVTATLRDEQLGDWQRIEKQVNDILERFIVK